MSPVLCFSWTFRVIYTVDAHCRLRGILGARRYPVLTAVHVAFAWTLRSVMPFVALASAAFLVDQAEFSESHSLGVVRNSRRWNFP